MDTIKDGNVKTRKDHICEWCSITYPKGTVMRSSVFVEDQKAFTIYTCNICVEWFKRNIKPDDYESIDFSNIPNHDPDGWLLVKAELDTKN